MDERWLKRVETEVNDPTQDQYLVARDVGRDLLLRLIDKPVTREDDDYAALGAGFIDLLQKHKLLAAVEPAAQSPESVK